MRFSFATTTTVVAIFVAYACASGKATDDGAIHPVGSGGATTAQPGNGGATTPTSATGGSTAKGGAATGGAATGGAATGGAPCTPTPLASWKSFAACKATQAEMTTAYTSWKALYYAECSDGTAYAKSTDPSGTVAVVSEGVAYGMLMTANLGNFADFKKFWATYKKFKNANGLMSWKLNANSCPLAVASDGGATNAASDADIDAAMALLVAAKAGFDASYATEAKTLIAAVKSKETASCSGKTVLLAGDSGWGCSDLNPSYFAPGYFRVFATVSGDTSWNQMATDALTLLTQWQSAHVDSTTNALDGKVPDWGKGDGSQGGSISSRASTYGWEACRVPWRVAADYGWFKTPEAHTFLATMDTKVVKGIGGGFPGNALTDATRNSAFAGGYGLCGTAIDQDTANKYFNDWYVNRNLVGDDKYYQRTLRVLYLIMSGGRFDNGQ